jgi:uncharacterized protein YprB with RNaseH-like and TPR domain
VRPGNDASAAGNSVRDTSAIRPLAKSAAAGIHPLPGLLRRGDVVETAAGRHLRVRLPLEDFWPGGERLVTARQQFLKELVAAAGHAVEPTVVMDVEFAALVGALPDRALLLDLETCGLAGAALFLIGLLRQIDGAPTIELLMARNYAEEAAVLESFWQIVADHDILMTFNGKSFDWPMVHERSIRHRLQTCGGDRPLQHLDILHHARRRWRRHLPDCRLQTLERIVCRRHRTGDIPGHRIPAVYAEFVRTGFERDIDAVLHHNALDLVTLFDLALRLAA